MEEIQKPTVSSKMLDATMSILSLGFLKPKKDNLKFNSAEEALGEIFKLMVKIENDRELREEENINSLMENHLEEGKRNQELIKALTGRKKPKIEKQKKEIIEKPETKPETLPQQTTKPPEVKPPAKAEAPKSVTPPKVSRTESVIPEVGKSVAKAAVGIGIAVGATEVIAKEEGVSRDKKTGQVAAYWDPPGQKALVSIGYGHQIKKEEYEQGFISVGDEKINIVGDRGIGTRMTLEQAKKLLAIDIPKYEKRAKDPLGDSWNKLNDEQKTALTSYAYNVGSTNSLVKVGLKEAIDSGDMKGAANIIREKGIRTAKGQFSPELDARRRREADLFESGIKQQPKINVPSSNVYEASEQNQQLNLQSDISSAQQKIIVNNTQMNTSSSSQQQIPEQFDDRPAIVKKGRK